MSLVNMYYVKVYGMMNEDLHACIPVAMWALSFGIGMLVYANIMTRRMNVV